MGLGLVIEDGLENTSDGLSPQAAAAPRQLREGKDAAHY